MLFFQFRGAGSCALITECRFRMNVDSLEGRINQSKCTLFTFCLHYVLSLIVNDSSVCRILKKTNQSFLKMFSASTKGSLSFSTDFPPNPLSFQYYLPTNKFSMIQLISQVHLDNTCYPFIFHVELSVLGRDSLQ